MQTPIQRRAILAYAANDHSRIYRDENGHATCWADVNGQVHGLPIDPLKMGKVGRAQLREDDTQIIRGAKVVDARKFAEAFAPTWEDNVVMLLSLVMFTASIVCMVWILAPEPTFPAQEIISFPPVEPTPQYDYGDLDDMIRAGVKK